MLAKKVYYFISMVIFFITWISVLACTFAFGGKIVVPISIGILLILILINTIITLILFAIDAFKDYNSIKK